jgi:hypothetical protein
MTDAEMSPAESAVLKLEAFLASLTPDEQAELEPLFAAGLERAYEDAQGEVIGMSAMTFELEPKFLSFVGGVKTPVLHGFGGGGFEMPMPGPM